MVLSKETVNAYKECLTNPQQHGLGFKPLSECFEISETATPKHTLYEGFLNYLQRPLPKILFYIIMAELYGDFIDNDPITGCIGYKLKLVDNPDWRKNKSIEIGSVVTIKQDFIDRYKRTEFNSTDKWTVDDVYPIGDNQHVASIKNNDTGKNAQLCTYNLTEVFPEEIKN